MSMNIKKCNLCNHKCGIDRSAGTGYCGIDDKIHVAHYGLHRGEEPFLTGDQGSGTIFFAVSGPLLAPLFPGRALMEKSASALSPGMEFASTGYQEPSLVWYARRYVTGWYTPLPPEKLSQFMARPGPRFCVAPAGILQPSPEWRVFETHGFNLVHFRRVHLQLMAKTE